MALRSGLLSMTFALAAAAGAVLPGAAGAQTTHYVAAKGMQITCSGPQGQAGCPWSTVRGALDSGRVAGGDTLLLMDGLHDMIVIIGPKFAEPVTIRSQNERRARVDAIFLRNAAGITFRDLTVISTGAHWFPLIRTDPDATRLVFDRLDLRSRENVDDVMSWTQAQWLERRRHGVWIYGTHTAVTNSTVRAVQSGIWSGGSHNRIENNHITMLTADGLRAGSHTVVRGNYVADFLRVDDDHLDGFQSIAGVTWPVTGLVVDGNTIIERTFAAGHPLQSALQGIGLFDGFYDDLTIQNNVVSVSSHHGITVAGGRGGRIVNNTVVQLSGNPQKFPWILVAPHKNGTPSRDMIVANNVAMHFAGASEATNIRFLDNQVIFYPAQTFMNVAAFDYRPRPDSGMIDSANPLLAPPTDILGTRRPLGAAPDRGAYEMAVAPRPPEPPVETDETRLGSGTSSVTTDSGGTTVSGGSTGSGTSSMTESAPQPAPVTRPGVATRTGTVTFIQNTAPLTTRRTWTDITQRR